MEKLSDKLASNIAAELGTKDEEKQVLAYGAFALIQMCITILLLIIISTILNVLAEALIISFTGGVLRKYSGGVHATSPGRCTFLGTFICLASAVIIKSFTYDSRIIWVVVIVYPWAYYMIKKLVPVDSPNKPIRNQSKRAKMKKGALRILNIYMLLITMNLILFIDNQGNNFIIYSVCIIFGLAWQIFTLTKPSFYIFKMIDQYLNIIVKFIKEVRYYGKVH